jgi:hypothetical protein
LRHLQHKIQTREDNASKRITKSSVSFESDSKTNGCEQNAGGQRGGRWCRSDTTGDDASSRLRQALKEMDTEEWC